MVRAVFWIFLACIGAPESYGFSKNVMDVLSIYNGYWKNTQETGDHSHEVTQVWVTPVDVPALYPNPALVLKEVANGVLRILNVLELNDGAEINTVNAKIYNFTDITKDEAKTYDLEKLKTIKREDLQSSDDCFGVFDDVTKAHFLVANFPYCKYVSHGKHPRFGLTLSCDTAVVTFPLGIDQASPEAPYVFQHIGPRYPLINQPKDYVSPCAK